MNHVVCLIVNPLVTKISEFDLKNCANILSDDVALDHAWRWLSAGEAAEMLLPTAPSDETQTKAKQFCQSKNIDCHFLAEEQRYPKLLIADMDSTIIEQECIDEIAAVKGLKEKVAAITEAAMEGELDFNQALEARVKLLDGIQKQDLQTIYQDRITPSPEAEILIKALKKKGVFTALVSGGFTFFTDQIKARLGFDYAHANTLGFDNQECLTGAVLGEIVNAQTKKETLLSLCQQQAITAHQAWAIGDGANDLEMIKTAGLGIAYKAKQKTREQADTSVQFAGLKSLLFMMGLTQQDIDGLL